MSFNPLQPLETVSGIDPRIDYDNEHSYLAYRGAKDISYVDYNPTNSSGTSADGQTTFNLFAPSRETSVDRLFLLTGTAEVVITQLITQVGGTAIAAGLPFAKNCFAPQSFPMNSCIDNITLQIDNQTINVRHSDLFPLLKQYYFSEEELKYFNSTTPTLFDNEIFFKPGTVNNVLNTNTETPYSVIPSRGSFPLNTGSYILTRTATAGDGQRGTSTSKLYYTFTEPIMLPPLALTAMNRTAGFNGISNIKIQIIWKSPASSFSQGYSLAVLKNESTSITENLSGLYAVDSGTLATTYTPPNPVFPTLGATPSSNTTWTGTMTFSGLKLCVGYLTLPDIQVPPVISTFDFYNFTYVTRQLESIPPSTGTTTRTIMSDNIQLPCVPHEVYVAVVPQSNSTDTTTVSATLGPINKAFVGQFKLPLKNFRINVANQTALLSTQPPHLFYKHSLENGLSFISYNNSGDFYSLATKPSNVLLDAGNSYVLTDPPISHLYCFKFGKDLQLADSSLSPGVSCNLNFQLQCDVSNYLSATFTTAQLYIIFGYEGVYTISPSKGASLQYFGLLSRQDVLDASTEVDMSEIMPPSSYGGAMVAGGSFFSKLKKFGKKAVKFIGKNKEKLHQAVKLASELGVPFAGDVDRAINMGEKLVQGSQAVHGSGGRLISPSMGMITGSGMVTASQMRQRLMK